MEHKFSFLRTSALIRKEFYQIIRDPSCLLISVVLPLILLFVYGFGVSLDLDHLRIGLVLEDTSPDAQSFAQALTNSKYFDVKVARDRRVFEKDIIRGSIRGIVVVPSYFSEFKNRPYSIAPIQVISDGSEPNTASFVQNYVRSAFQNWKRIESISRKPQNSVSSLAEISTPAEKNETEENMEDLEIVPIENFLTGVNTNFLLQQVYSSRNAGLPLISLQSRFWYNEELESRNFLIPGSLAIIMTLIGTLLTALVVAREWERGTMEALISTPVLIREILIGKLVPYFVLGFLTMGMCVIVATLFYEVPLRGSFIALICLTSVFLTTALGLGLLISTLSKNQFVAGQVSLVTAFLPAFMLSGFIFEISSMPFWIQCITYVLSARYFVTGLQTLFLVGDVWKLFLSDLIPMALIGCIFFAICSKKLSKRLE